MASSYGLQLQCMYPGSQVNEEKTTLENRLATEQEYLDNQLQKKVKNLSVSIACSMTNVTSAGLGLGSGCEHVLCCYLAIAVMLQQMHRPGEFALLTMHVACS